MPENSNTPYLHYIPLGGNGEVTKNMHVFETQDDIVVFDAGIGFPQADQLGVDVVIPDVSYLIQKRHKVRGIVISHAHEDHIGALPYIVKELTNVPIYATKLPRGFIQAKLAEKNLLKGQPLHLIEPEKGAFKVGKFEINPYRVNHSVPDALGLFVRTPVGNIVMSPDFKFDWTPVDGHPFEVGKLASLAQDGVLALFSDCLGSNRDGYTESERSIEKAFDRELRDAKGQVFITTMSSNISRIQQAINVSHKYGRKVVPAGRSIDQNIQTALNLGYLKVPDGAVIDQEKARRMPGHKKTYLVAGAMGQPGSALDRLSRGEHRSIQIKPGAAVIFSADPIPGVGDQVGSAIDRLIEKGVRVVYSDIQDDLHVSGHGSKGDLSLMVGLTRPEFFIPIGGTRRHQRGYTTLVEDMGYDPKTVFELLGNQTVMFHEHDAKLGPEIETRDVFVDGSLVGDVGKIVLEDRMQLSQDGVFVIIMRKDKEGKLSNIVDVISRGFVFQAESGELVKHAKQLAGKTVQGTHIKEWNKTKEKLTEKLRSLFFSKTKREPLILPVVIDL